MNAVADCPPPQSALILPWQNPPGKNTLEHNPLGQNTGRQNLLSRIRRSQSGAAMLELAITAPVILLLGLGSVQIGLIYHARSILNYATFEAARKGAVNHAQSAAMLEELGSRLGPVFGGNASSQSLLDSVSSAVADVQNPVYTRLQIISPSDQAFEDWAVLNTQTGQREIPNSHLRQRHQARVAGKHSGVNLQDANLLKILVTYGYKMSVPVVGKLFAALLHQLNPAQATFYQARRIPLTAVATVRMQSVAWPDGDPDSQQPDSSAAVSGVVPANCDPNGFAADQADAELDSLMQINDSNNQCGAAAVSINTLLELAFPADNAIGDCVVVD